MSELTQVAKVSKLTSNFQKVSEKFTEDSKDYLSEDEKNNVILDTILDFQKRITKINNIYKSLLDGAQDLFLIDAEKIREDDRVEILSIVKSIKQINNEVHITFLRLYKNKIISQGCKSYLQDLRINMAGISELTSDVIDYILNNGSANNKAKEILSQF